MELKIKLNENDYLSYQLFVASKSKRIKNKRKTEWLLTSFIFLIFAFIFYYLDNFFLLYYFLIFGLLSFLFLPYYVSWRYKNHYLRHIKDVYKNNFGKEVIIRFTDEFIESFDSASEAKVKFSQVKEINETGTHLFIQFFSGHALILPKNTFNEINDISTFFRSITKTHNIKVNQFLNWKWK